MCNATNLVETSIDNLIANSFKVIVDLHPVSDEVADVVVAHYVPHPVTG